MTAAKCKMPEACGPENPAEDEMVSVVNLVTGEVPRHLMLVSQIGIVFVLLTCLLGVLVCVDLLL